jgi:copper resistance protein B
MRLVLAASLIALPASPAAAAEPLPYVDLDEAEPELAGGGVSEAKAEASGARLEYVLLDRFEWAPQRGADGYAWDFSAWYGGTDGIWLSSVGEGSLWGAPEYLEFQALYARDLGRGLQFNLGPRWDAKPAPQRFYLATGGQWEPTMRGEDDLWFGAFTYLSHKGELTARLGGIYNHQLRGKLFLQPSFELNASAQDVPELGLGRGLSYAEAGLRLRYATDSGFAPYVGVSWERAFGRTAQMARDAGEDVESRGVVIGLRYNWDAPSGE